MKKNSLVKVIGILAIIAIVMTWIFSTGSFSGTSFQDAGLSRIGFSDIPVLLYYAIYFSLDKIVYLLFLAGFYGVLSKTSGYQKLVASLASKIEKQQKISVLIISLLIVALTAMSTQVFAVILFVPFLISVLLKSGIKKLPVFATTFGSILVGTLAPIYGTEGLTYFNQYVTIEFTDNIWIKIAILVCGYFLLNILTILAMKPKEEAKPAKGKKAKVNAEEVEDVFAIEEPKEKTKIYPIIIVLGILAIITIMSFIDWSIFNIKIFTDLHDKLLNVKIGEDFTIISNILGSASQAIGSWDLLTLSIVLLIASVIIAFMYRVSINDYIESFGEGIKKLIKPIGIVLLCYFVFAILYNSAIIPYITSKILPSGSSFNALKVSLMALITNIFHLDLGFTGYSVGSYLSALYSNSLSAVSLIYLSVYGFISFIAPTSIVLMFGLSYLDIDYLSWIKYIWKFILAMLIVLVFIFLVIL